LRQSPWFPDQRRGVFGAPGKKSEGVFYAPGNWGYALSKRHDISRQLIRVWVEKYEAGGLDEDAQAADLLQEYEAKIAALDTLFNIGVSRPPQSCRELGCVQPQNTCARIVSTNGISVAAQVPTLERPRRVAL
jgi:transposase-like protein